MKLLFRIVPGIALASGLTCAAVFAQGDRHVPDNQNAGDLRPLMSDYNAATWYQQLGNNGYGPHSKSAELAQSYVKAQGEEEKTRIRKKLTEVLSEQFDQHSKKQEKELEEIEKQIANLKGLLKRRLDAKSTIVERRADQLIRDADGLGWTAPSSPNLYSIPHPAWTTLPSDSPKQPAAATPLAK